MVNVRKCIWNVIEISKLMTYTETQKHGALVQGFPTQLKFWHFLT